VPTLGGKQTTIGNPRSMLQPWPNALTQDILGALVCLSAMAVIGLVVMWGGESSTRFQSRRPRLNVRRVARQVRRSHRATRATMRILTETSRRAALGSILKRTG